MFEKTNEPGEMDEVMDMLIGTLHRMQNRKDWEKLAYVTINISLRYPILPETAQKLIEYLFAVEAPLPLITDAMLNADRRFKERALDLAITAGNLRCARRLEKMLDRSLTSAECRTLLVNFVHQRFLVYVPELEFIDRYLTQANSPLLTERVRIFLKKYETNRLAV